MKILMAEDDADDRHLSKVAFDRLQSNNELTFAEDGEELLENLNSRLDSKEPLPDIILLDINMPRKNGFEALREIKQDEKLKHLYVIIFTTSQLEKDKTEALQIGANDFIVKPSNLTGLVEVFRKIFAQQI